MRRLTWYVVVVAITLVILISLWQFSIAIVLFALVPGCCSRLTTLD